MRRALVSTVVAAAVVGSAGTALAVTGGSSSPVFSGCIARANRALINVHKAASVKCAKGETEISWNQKGPRGAAGPQGPAGPPGKSFQPVEASAVFNLTGRDDSGSGGNTWAKDTITRTVTVIRQDAVPATDCGATATKCWFYTMTVSDTGTFKTQPGLTPNQSCTEPEGQACNGLRINGTIVGSFTGGGDQEFYADQAAPKVPKVLSYTGDAPIDTSHWNTLFFPSTTNFGFPAATSAGQPWTNWSWTYAAPKTCEMWTDAYNTGSGSGNYVTDGNIAGINQCT
jgi:hypothetical protein